MQDYFQSLVDSAENIVDQLYDHFVLGKGCVHFAVPEVLRPYMEVKLTTLVNQSPKFQQWKDGSKFIYKFEVMINQSDVLCFLRWATPRETLTIHEIRQPILNALGPLIDDIPKNTISWSREPGLLNIPFTMFSRDMWQISTIPFEQWIKHQVHPFLYPGFEVTSVDTNHTGLFYITIAETQEQADLRHQKVQAAIKRFFP